MIQAPSGNHVVIMRNIAGSAWLQAGRTGVCPTPEWLRDNYGDGRYELRLVSGKRLLCVVQVGTPGRAQAARI